MGELIGIVCMLIFPLGLFALGLVVGGMTERRHLADLARRETALQNMLVTQLKTFPQGTVGPQPPMLLMSEAVISSDYLKTFLGGMKKIFGGEIKSFQTLADRARREAALRVLEQARQRGYNAVCNLRLETSKITTQTGNKGIVAVEIIASGTAYYANV